MSRTRLRLPLRGICSILALSLASALVACGDSDLEAATAEVAAIEARVEQARAEVERADATASEADEAQERARATLEQAEQQLADARQRVDLQTGDATLFRNVQQQLLDEDDLEGVAVTARVKRRVVTLEGNVPNERLKQLAEQIASSTTGVASVVNQITIDVAAPPERRAD